MKAAAKTACLGHTGQAGGRGEGRGEGEGGEVQRCPRVIWQLPPAIGIYR